MDFMRGTFGNFRCVWWDPQDEDRVMTCSDGGVNVSYDRGKTVDWFLNMKIGEVYAVGVDMTEALGVVEAGAPAERWVSRVFASPHDAGTAFVSKTGFRNDDFRPFLCRRQSGRFSAVGSGSL